MVVENSPQTLSKAAGTTITPQVIPILGLWPMTAPKAIEELSAILENEPIVHPIVVYITNKEEWAKHKEQVPYIDSPPEVEGEILQIRAGHNRVEWLKRQGITEVLALVYDDMREAQEECMRQMTWHKQRHGALI